MALCSNALTSYSVISLHSTTLIHNSDFFGNQIFVLSIQSLYSVLEAPLTAITDSKHFTPGMGTSCTHSSKLNGDSGQAFFQMFESGLCLRNIHWAVPSPPRFSALWIRFSWSVSPVSILWPVSLSHPTRLRLWPPHSTEGMTLGREWVVPDFLQTRHSDLISISLDQRILSPTVRGSFLYFFTVLLVTFTVRHTFLRSLPWYNPVWALET